MQGQRRLTWAEGAGARTLRGVRKDACEDACENACKDARGVEEKEARDGNVAPSTSAPSRITRIVWETTSEALRDSQGPLRGWRGPLRGSQGIASRAESQAAIPRTRKKISGKRSESI